MPFLSRVMTHIYWGFVSQAPSARLSASCVYLIPIEWWYRCNPEFIGEDAGLKRIRKLQKAAHLIHGLAFSDCRPFWTAKPILWLTTPWHWCGSCVFRLLQFYKKVNSAHRRRQVLFWPEFVWMAHGLGDDQVGKGKGSCVPHRIPLLLRHGLSTGSIGFAWKLVRNTESWTPFQTLLEFVLTRAAGGTRALLSTLIASRNTWKVFRPGWMPSRYTNQRNQGCRRGLDVGISAQLLSGSRGSRVEDCWSGTASGPFGLSVKWCGIPLLLLAVHRNVQIMNWEDQPGCSRTCHLCDSGPVYTF